MKIQILKAILRNQSQYCQVLPNLNKRRNLKKKNWKKNKKN